MVVRDWGVGIVWLATDHRWLFQQRPHSLAIVGGPEWKCVVLGHRHDGCIAYLTLYVQDDLVGLLRPAAVTRKSGERRGCSHRPHRAFRAVNSRWLCPYPSPFL